MGLLAAILPAAKEMHFCGVTIITEMGNLRLHFYCPLLFSAVLLSRRSLYLAFTGYFRVLFLYVLINIFHTFLRLKKKLRNNDNIMLYNLSFTVQDSSVMKTSN